MPSAITVDTADYGVCQSTGPDTVDDICLGIELKFLMLGLPRSHCSIPAVRERLSDTEAVNCDAHYKQAYSVLARVIEQGTSLDKVVPSASMLPIQTHAISRHEIAASGLAERDYWSSHWIVKKANSAELMKEDPRPDVRCTSGIAVPVELSSPKLAWKNPCVPFLVNKVLFRIKTFPAYINYTCDVHVHVGRCDGSPFTLTTLKKLATIFWLAEPLLRSVRNPHSPNFSNTYTWGFEQRRYSRLALALEGRSTPTDTVTTGDSLLARVRSGLGTREEEEEWRQYMGNTDRANSTDHIRSAGVVTLHNDALRTIWRCSSTQELGLLLSGPQKEHRRLGFNFSAFGGEDERARTNPRTIEFRILEGTLQEDLVQGWLQICGKLTELGTKGRQAQFHDTVRYLLAHQDSYEDLANNADLSHSWGRSRSEHHEGLSRDVLFAQFMEHIGVSAAVYGPFQDKIRREYRSS